jgi:hypothetical protein
LLRTRWRDVTEVRVVGQTLEVLGARDARIDLRRVPHPWLLIRLVTALAGRR